MDQFSFIGSSSTLKTCLFKQYVFDTKSNKDTKNIWILRANVPHSSPVFPILRPPSSCSISMPLMLFETVNIKGFEAGYFAYKAVLIYRRQNGTEIKNNSN